MYDRMIGLEQKYGATSTFFVVPANSTANSESLQRLSTAGAEIGLHNIGQSYRSLSEMLKQKEVVEKLLRSKIFGIRSHRLDLMIPRTFEFQRLCGFRYDSSFYPPRYGRKRIYKPFFATDELLELPLALVDSDFEEMASRSHDAVERTWRRIERILEDFRKQEGVCTILWHPTAFYDERIDLHASNFRRFRGFDALYERILQYGSERGDKMCSCAKVLQLWKTTEEEPFW